jgi:serine/threonine-protein kinase
MSVAFQHVSTEAPLAASLNSDIGESLSNVVTKAMRKDPSARYQTADEMRSDLLSVLRGEAVGAAIIPVAAGAAVAAGSDATRVMTAAPPATVPPDEVYRQIEDEPRSQLPFILTAFGLLITLVVLFFILFQSANGNNGEGELIEIPNVIGQTQQEALDRLQLDGFRVKVIPEPSAEVEPGLVIRTNPLPGFEAEEGSLVDVIVSTGIEEVQVPPLVGQTLDNARILIESANLVVGEVDERPDAERAAGVVIEQNPGQGVSVGAGTPVNLVVSTGPEIVVVPNVVDMSERDATAALRDLGLLVTVNDEFSSEVPNGFVISSDPVAGTEAETGETVLLVVSQGPRPVTVPNLTGLTPSQAQAQLENLGLVMATSSATQPVVDPGQDGRVVSQFPTQGTTLFPGDVVTITLGKFEPPPTTAPPTTTPPTTPPTTTP